MKNIFYGLLSFFIISFIFFAIDIDRKVNLDEREGGIVIEISHDYFTGTVVYVQMPNDSIYYEHVYQIVIKDLEVGDTVKIIK